MNRRSLPLSLLAPALALVLAACGSSGGGSSGRNGAGASLPAPLAQRTQATLVLDFVPNAIHAGIYRALVAGYYSDENINLRIIQPTSTSDTLKLIDAGRAQFGLADGSDVASLIDHGGDARAVMAIVQQPLGGLIGLASEDLRSAASLAGKTVGITGVPSDRAVLDTVVRDAGGDPSSVHVVTVGFNGAQALVAGRLAAFTGFIPDEGVQLSAEGHPIKAFPLAGRGGPSYPGLVAFTTGHEISSHRHLVRDFVAATVKGYEDTIADPGRSLADLLRQNPDLNSKLTRDSLRAYLPLFTDGGRVPFGKLRASSLESMSRWMLASHLIGSPISPSRYGTDQFLPGP